VVFNADNFTWLVSLVRNPVVQRLRFYAIFIAVFPLEGGVGFIGIFRSFLCFFDSSCWKGCRRFYCLGILRINLGILSSSAIESNGFLRSPLKRHGLTVILENTLIFINSTCLYLCVFHLRYLYRLTGTKSLIIWIQIGIRMKLL